MTTGMTGWAVYATPCPVCGADPFAPCEDGKAGSVLGFVHTERTRYQSGNGIA